MGGQNISRESGWSKVTDNEWTVIRITKAADWVSEDEITVLRDLALEDDQGLSTIRIDPNGEPRREIRQAVRRRETEPGRNGETFSVAKSHILVQIDQRLKKAIEPAGVKIALFQDDYQTWHIVILEEDKPGTSPEFSAAAKEAIQENPDLIKLFNREGEQLTQEQAASMIRETKRRQEADLEKFQARSQKKTP